MMAKWLVLVNPAAGRTSTDPKAVSEALTTAGVSYEQVVPRSVDETRSALRDGVSRGFSHFAVAGGDGTVNLAVNQLLALDLEEKPTLGVLPGGTGCDLLRTFALPQDLAGAARHLATEDVYEIDVVTLEGSWGLRYYVNVAQVGVGAAAAETAVKINRRMGAIRYPMAFGVRLPRFPRAQVTVTTERRTHTADALAVIMANAQFFAGGWNVAPRATLIDGVVDIQVISARKSQAPGLVPKVIKGTHLADPSVRRFEAAEFTIETDVPWPLEADGDLVGNTPVSGRVVPAAIRLKI
jgi:diacylglycerol kinase (ATP)